MINNLPAMLETQVQSLGQEDPLEKRTQPTPVFLPEEAHRQRCLVGYSPWGCKESDTAEQLTLSLVSWDTSQSSGWNEQGPQSWKDFLDLNLAPHLSHAGSSAQPFCATVSSSGKWG